MTEQEYNRRRYLPRQLKAARQRVDKLRQRQFRLPNQLEAARAKVRDLEAEAERFQMAQYLRCYGLTGSPDIQGREG